jgi:hypothetical protein
MLLVKKHYGTTAAQNAYLYEINQLVMKKNVFLMEIKLHVTDRRRMAPCPP